MSVNAPPQVTPDPGFIEQLLMELGEKRARLEQYEEAERQRQAQLEAEQVAEARIRDASLQQVCELRWVMQPQNGGVLVGDRSYRGRGPARNRANGQISSPGTRFMATADDARVLVESGYAEILNGEEHILAWNDRTPLAPGQARWTTPVVVRPDAAPPPAADDADGWNARAVWDS